MVYLKQRTVYVGWADEKPNDFSLCKPSGCAMALLRPLSAGEGAAADVELEREAPPLGTTTPGWPSAPSWTSLNSCLDGTRGVSELDLTISGSDLVTELRGRALDELPMST